jgi:hypothetical protein
MSTLPMAEYLGNNRWRSRRGLIVMCMDVRADSRCYALYSEVTNRLILAAYVYDNVWNPGRALPRVTGHEPRVTGHSAP